MSWVVEIALSVLLYNLNSPSLIKSIKHLMIHFSTDMEVDKLKTNPLEKANAIRECKPCRKQNISYWIDEDTYVPSMIPVFGKIFSNLAVLD